MYCISRSCFVRNYICVKMKYIEYNDRASMIFNCTMNEAHNGLVNLGLSEAL